MPDIINMKGDLNIEDLGLEQFLDQVENAINVDSLGFRGILKTSTVSWVYLPEDVLLIIFKILNGKDLANIVKVCSRWRMLGDTEELWEKMFKQDFNVEAEVPLRSGAQSWKKEYERLSDNVPCVELDKIEEHVDEVLHVSFSHNGMMFCTCSKDAYVKVYNADWPFNTVFSAHHGGNKSYLNWKYTQLSEFSPCDTQLLVSGRNDVSVQGGEIVIYNIFAGEFSIQARVRILPYDVMGTWLNETHILSAVAHQRVRTMQCLTEVVLNKSAQDIENTHQSTVTRAFLFLSNNLATVSYLQVADVARPIRQVIKRHFGCELKDCLHEMHLQYLTKNQKTAPPNIAEGLKNVNLICIECTAKSTLEHKVKRFKPGSPLDRGERTTCFSFCSKNKLRERDCDCVADPDPNPLLKSCGVLGSDTDSLAEPSGLQQRNSSRNFNPDQMNETNQLRIRRCISCGKPILSIRDDVVVQSEIDSSSATSADEDSSLVFLPRNYKLLLCFTGQHSCIPHQIGVKVIEKEECSQVVERDINEQLRGSDNNRPEVDDWDHRLELHGHGIGMTVSPCNRYLYVNVRRWLGDWRQIDLEQHFLNPQISDQVDLLVFDLVTMKQISTLTGHNSDNDVFFIHLSCNDFYVASGSGDACGYMYDRHYGTRIALLPHENVVNCVAVNPRDPSMAVSVSDDKSIKIWRSKAFSRLLKGARPKARIRLRPHNSHLPKS